ncbi:MAG: T9SS type A sorting domain-containing protein [Chitinophagales bacterium]|nr:T9SS type A sorting domain-containing protein [Chitinophagales bacterium]
MKTYAQCDCPTSPTNISIVAGYPVNINKNENDVAWNAAAVDEDNSGSTDWYVVVGSTVPNTTNGKDAFAMRVNLDGSTIGTWYYTRNFQNRDEEIMSVFITSDNKILLCGKARTNYLDPCRYGVLSTDSSSNSLAVFPNPSTGDFNISLKLDEVVSGSVKLEVLDQASRVCLSEYRQIENGSMLNFNSMELPTGMYFIRASIAESTYLAKLLIQKN